MRELTMNEIGNVNGGDGPCAAAGAAVAAVATIGVSAAAGLAGARAGITAGAYIGAFFGPVGFGVGAVGYLSARLVVTGAAGTAGHYAGSVACGGH